MRHVTWNIMRGIYEKQKRQLEDCTEALDRERGHSFVANETSMVGHACFQDTIRDIQKTTRGYESLMQHLMFYTRATGDRFIYIVCYTPSRTLKCTA